MIAALPWIALGLMAAAIVAAFGAILARSLFAMCMHLIAAGASVAAMALVLGAGESALAIVLFAAAWAPVLVLAAMLLSARAAKDMRRGWPWLSLAGAAAALCAIWWPLLQLGPVADAHAAYAPAGFGFWLAPLLLVTAVACVGLLGYGERGALGREGDAP
jgi:hypothetical protein